MKKKRSGAAKSRSASSLPEQTPENKTDATNISIAMSDKGGTNKSKDISPETLQMLNQIDLDIQNEDVGAGAIVSPPVTRSMSSVEITNTVPKQPMGPGAIPAEGARGYCDNGTSDNTNTRDGQNYFNNARQRTSPTYGRSTQYVAGAPFVNPNENILTCPRRNHGRNYSIMASENIGLFYLQQHMNDAHPDPVTVKMQP